MEIWKVLIIVVIAIIALSTHEGGICDNCYDKRY